MSEKININESKDDKEKVFNLKDVISPEFYNKMSEFNPKIKRREKIDLNLIPLSFILSIFATLFIYMNFETSINIIILFISCFLVSLFLIFVITLTYVEIIYKSIATIDYNGNEIDLSNFETDFPLTEINKNFKVQIKDKSNLSEDLIDLINAGKERGGYYNYEISILQRIQKLNKENTLEL